MSEIKDDKLWRIARKRAEFRKSLYSYIVVITFLWIVWWFTMGRVTGLTGYPWPVWVMLGWGIGIIMQYFKAYKGSSDEEMAEQEYDKLKKKQDGF